MYVAMSLILTLQILHNVGYMRRKVTSQPSSGSSSPSIFSRIFSTKPKQILQRYKDAPSGKIFQIMRVRNRFADINKESPLWSGGFRDLAFKVKVGFKVPLFSSRTRLQRVHLSLLVSGVFERSTAVCACVRRFPACDCGSL